VIKLGRSPALQTFVWIRWAVDTPRGGNICGHYDFLFVFIFFNRATANTREPFFAHNSSTDAVWCKEDPFGVDKCVILKIWGVLTKNTPKIGRKGQLPAKIKCLITPKRYKRNAKYVKKPLLWNWGRSSRFRQQNLCEMPRSGEITMTSRWRHVQFKIKPYHLANDAS